MISGQRYKFLGGEFEDIWNIGECYTCLPNIAAGYGFTITNKKNQPQPCNLYWSFLFKRLCPSKISDVLEYYAERKRNV